MVDDWGNRFFFPHVADLKYNMESVEHMKDKDVTVSKVSAPLNANFMKPNDPYLQVLNDGKS